MSCCARITDVTAFRSPPPTIPPASSWRAEGNWIGTPGSRSGELATRGTTVDELAQSVPLVRFETLTLVRVGVLRSAGFRLDPTGRNRQHFTVVFAELDRCVEALVSCEHLNWVNPYHEH